MKKIEIEFKSGWKLTEFVDVNSSPEQLKKTFPNAVKITQDKSFRTLAHGKSDGPI